MERQTGHHPRPCPVGIVGPRRTLLFLRLAFDVSFLPQLLSLLSRFNCPTKLYHHEYICRQPPDHGRLQWHAPVVVGAAENYARPVDVAAIRFVRNSMADRSALFAAIPPLLGGGPLTPCKTSTLGKYALPRLPRKMGDKCVLAHEGSEDHFARYPIFSAIFFVARLPLWGIAGWTGLTCCAPWHPQGLV